MSNPLDRETVARIGALAIGEGRGFRETARMIEAGMDGGPAIRITAETVRRNVQRLRREGQIDVRPSALASRMLRLVEREIARMEALRGEADLDRLDKLAATLRRLEPVRSVPEGKPDLRSVLASEPRETEGLSALDPDVRSAEG